MSDFVNSVKIETDANMKDIDRVRTQVRTLILSAEECIPGSRGFGLRREFLSRRPEEAVNVFAVELEEKMDEYISDAEVTDVRADFSRVLDGGVDITVRLGRRE